jgi:hypothetical protein
MGLVVCGIEMTDEDMVVSSEGVQEAIDQALLDLGLAEEPGMGAKQDRAVLETLVWRVVKRFAVDFEEVRTEFP